MSFAIRWFSGSSARMRPIPRRTPAGSNRCVLDRRMTRPSNCLVLNRQRTHPINASVIRHFLSQLLSAIEVRGRVLSVAFVDDGSMRGYYKRYRGFDKPTDVLSFRGENDYLGDILISAETAYNQARKSPTLTFESNIRRLLVHGVLHLVGYDHETDNGEMR